MGVTYDFKDIYKTIENVQGNISAKLIELGNRAVALAVEKGEYENITGNLRSSIGYVVVKNGKIIDEGGFTKIPGRGANMQKVSFIARGELVSFKARGKSGDGSEGSKQGIEYARKIASQYPKGLVLVVVAGMEYASYVNSRFDVLNTAGSYIDSQMKKIAL